MSLDPLTAALDLGGKVLDRFVPDQAQRDAAKLELFKAAQAGDLALLAAQSGIVTAEANSDSWIAKSWRPILMLTFGVLIVARWFGWAAPNLTETEYIKLWDIVQLGLGGYVIGRSVEKTVPALAEALKGSK